MRALAILLLLCATSVHAQFGNCVGCARWEPRNFKSKLGLVADWDFGRPSLVTLNGAGISRIEDRVGTNALLQSTAAAQPLISRTDNSGNLLVQSEAFNTSAAWAPNRLNPFGAIDTGATNAGSFANTTRTTGPLGGNTADFIQEDATSGSHALTQTGVSVAPNTAISYSVFAKAAGRTWMLMTVLDGASGNGITSYFDLQNGTNAPATANGSGASASSSITSYTNGWYLCSLNGITSTSVAGAKAIVYAATTNGTVAYQGDSTSGLYLWGASLRQSSWSTNYIATTSTIAVPGLQGRATAYFDGSAHYLKANAFTLNQPETVVWLGQQITWTANKVIVDGNASDSMELLQSPTTPSLRLYANASAAANSGMTLGSYGVATAVFNSSSSSLQVNKTTPTTGDPGAANGVGFTLGRIGGTSANFGNIQTARVLLSNKVLATNELEFLRWGALKYAGVK